MTSQYVKSLIRLAVAMSRYSKKCLVSKDDLLGFFGEKV